MTLSQIAAVLRRPFSRAACSCQAKMPLVCWLGKWCTSPIWLLVKMLWWFRHYEIGALFFVAGLYAIGYQGLPNLHLKSPQEVWYDKGALELRKDLQRRADDPDYSWYSFVNPESEDFERSIRYYQDQQQAPFFDRLMYGRPDAELAAEAYLKMGVIKMMSSGDDQQNIGMAKALLEKAVELNPGIPYARDLIASPGRIDSLALQALAPERDLEMLYQNNPQQRSKPSPKKDGQKNGQGNQKGKKNGKQDGRSNKPQKQPGDKKNQQQQAPSSMNKMLQQNLQDVRNGTGNDGI